jgi:hypothetical protein
MSIHSFCAASCLRSLAVSAVATLAVWMFPATAARAQAPEMPGAFPLPAHTYDIVTGIDPRMCPSPLCGGV